jgi:hypothetical protein
MVRAVTDVRAVRLDDLGAWLLKGNADNADLARRFESQPRVDQWCVQPSYRTRLMEPGHPVVFWASGSRAKLPYGVWGVGELAGAPAFHPEDQRWHVPLALTILPAALRVPRGELRADPRLAGLEVFRQPQAANPSYLSIDQFAALRDHLPEVRDHLPEVTVR